MRAGASVNDIMGGMFGVIAIQAALAERQRTGRGRHIQSALYENNVFLMAQAMMFEIVTGQPSVPYSVKDSPWPVYDLFDTSDGSKTLRHHRRRGAMAGASAAPSIAQAWLDRSALCHRSGPRRPARLADSRRSPRSSSSGPRPISSAVASKSSICPYAPVNKPGDLFDDPHLNGFGRARSTFTCRTVEAKTPLLPVSMDGRRLQNRRDPPQIGEHTRDILGEIGFSSRRIASRENDVERLRRRKSVMMTVMARRLTATFDRQIIGNRCDREGSMLVHTPPGPR